MHGNTMRCKADVAPYMAAFGNPTNLPLTNTTYPAIRDAIRFEQRYWLPLRLSESGEVQQNIRGLVSHERFKGNHCAHTKADDPMRVAYFRDERHRYADRVTVAKPGGYLTSNYSRVFDATTIRNMAESMRVDNTDPTEFLFFAETEEEITEIYTENGGMNNGSCMRYLANNWNLIREGEHVHPAAVYAGPDTRVAYLKIGNKYKARTVVADRGNFETAKKWIRIYGDSGLMIRALESLGYRSGSLEGVRYAPIECDNGRLGAPYFDGMATRSSRSGDYFILGERGDYNNPAHCECVIGERATHNCGCCDDSFEESGMYWSTYHDEWICGDCYENHYVTTHSGDIVVEDDTILCQSDHENYICNSRELEHRGIVYCTDTNDYWFTSDCRPLMLATGELHWASDPSGADYANVHGTNLWIETDLDEARQHRLAYHVRTYLNIAPDDPIYIVDENGEPAPYIPLTHEATEAA